MLTRSGKALLLALLPAAIVMGSSAVVIAQCPPPPSTSPLAEGEVSLFFDPFGTVTCADITPGSVIPLYVVARVPAGGVAEFDIPELLTDALPPGLIIIAPAVMPPGVPYDELIVIDNCGRARRPDPSTCPVEQGDLLPISMTQVMAVAPVNGTACFQTACATIAGPVAGPPTYLRCDTGAAGEFTGGDSMCIGFGQAPVPVELSTWGAIKSLYDN